MPAFALSYGVVRGERKSDLNASPYIYVFRKDGQIAFLIRMMKEREAKNLGIINHKEVIESRKFETFFIILLEREEVYFEKR